jgi:DNA (cytosine-5)-methyltransferase 1
MSNKDVTQKLLIEAVDVWGQAAVAEALDVERETVNRWLKKKAIDPFNSNYLAYHSKLQSLFPQKPRRKQKFQFVDLFAGIGGLRRAFETVGGQCVFTSEWDEHAQRTYKANHYCDHPINGDIREITEGAPEASLLDYIDKNIPNHHVLLAGFPCQPFSIAGVSKKNALGRVHGFDCKTQGTLFFDICKIIKAKRPACFMLENVKNLKSHNKGDTYRTIIAELKSLGYIIPEPRVIDAADYLPQHRERIVIVGFRDDLNTSQLFDFSKVIPKRNHQLEPLKALLDSDNEVDDKYTLTTGLWDYLRDYKKKHRLKGNGFGYDLFTPDATYTRTLSARYYKDGSEILIAKSNAHVTRCEKGEERPRRLTPKECARLMGFDKPMESTFKIPVSDTQAYRQFGNSVVVPVFEAVARQMSRAILHSVELEKSRFEKLEAQDVDFSFAAS